MGMLNALGQWLAGLMPEIPDPPPPDVRCPKCAVIWRWGRLSSFDRLPPPNRVVYHKRGDREFIRETCYRCGYFFDTPCGESVEKRSHE